MGVLRARYMRGVKAWAKERQRQQQAEQEPEQQQQEDLNVAGEAPLLALEEEAAAAAEAGLCTGPRCEAGLARGIEPGLIARNGHCWRCHNLTRRLAVQGVLKGLLWNPAGEGSAARKRSWQPRRIPEPSSWNMYDQQGSLAPTRSMWQQQCGELGSPL